MVKKRKRLTLKQKEFNRQFKKEMIEAGVYSPPKKKLNRRKFADEVMNEFEEFNIFLEDALYLHRAMNWMMPLRKGKISPEQVGILKLLKLAVEIKKYMKTKEANGETKYTVDDLFNTVVKPIIDL